MYHIKIGETDFKIEPAQGGLSGKINPSTGSGQAEEYQLDIVKDGDEMHILRDFQSHRVSLVNADYETKTFTLRVNSNDYVLEAKDRFDLLLEELGMEDLASAGAQDLKAPMPGMVLFVSAKAGDEVEKGAPLLILEAMKMENVLKAESDGKVKAIHAEVGKAVEKGQVLVEFGE